MLANMVERIDPLLRIDFVRKLPPELTFHIFSYLDPKTLLTATLASRTWRIRILDSGLWKILYLREGWKANFNAIRKFEQDLAEALSPQTRRSRPQYAEPDLEEPKHKRRVPPTWLRARGINEANTAGLNGQAPTEADNEGDHPMTDATDRTLSLSTDGAESVAPPAVLPRPMLQPPLKPSLLTRSPNGTVRVNWVHLYKQRRRLEANWHHARFQNFQLPHPSYPEEAHEECVYQIQFQGKWVVSCSRDRTVRVWDLESKRLWHPPLLGHSRSVLCLQFDPSPEEDLIISGSSDKSVVMWQFSTGKKIHQISDAHGDSILNLKFNHRYLVTCSKDRTVKVWNRRELAPTDDWYPRVCNGGATYPSYIIDLKNMSPSVLEARLLNSQIKVLEPYSLLMTMVGHTAAVNSMQLHGDEIVTASGDRMVKLWSIRSGTCLKTMMGHEKGIACVQFDSHRIISGSNDDTIRIWDRTSGAEVACLRGHRSLVRTIQAGFADPPGATETLRLEAQAVEDEFLKAQEANAPVDLGPRAMRRAGHRSNTAGSRNPRDITALGAKIPPGGGGGPWGRIVSGSYDQTLLLWHKDSDGVWTWKHELRHTHATDNAERRAAEGLDAQAHQFRPPQAAPESTAATTIQAPNGDPATDPDTGNDSASSSANSDTAADPVQPAGAPNQPAAPTQADAAVPTPPTAPVAAPNNQISPQSQHHPQANHQPQPPRRGRAPVSRFFKLQFDSRTLIAASVDPRIVGWDFANDDEEIIEASQFFLGL